MAGGKGTRFWPLSREKTPKQLLSIVGERTMIQATFDRITPITPPERILVVTGVSHAEQIREQLPRIPPDNVIVEPVGRNTAPCVALASMIVNRRDPEGIMGVYPADHVIARPEELRLVVGNIVSTLADHPQRLVTMGIKPSYPETGYGYIKRGAPVADAIYEAEKFLEKPGADTASEYVRAGSYYWNSGMFFWSAATILDVMREHMPALMGAMEPIDQSVDTPGFADAVNRIYPGLTGESIDYGVMEKAGAQGRVMVAVTDPGWNDVGSWRSLYDLADPDGDGNMPRGDFISVDSRGIVTHNQNSLIAAIGVENLIIIETGDAIMVCHKDRAQDVRKVTDIIKRRGLDNLL